NLSHDSSSFKVLVIISYYDIIKASRKFHMARKETANQATARRMSQRPSQADYEALSEFRYLIRCFLQFSQNAARAVGLTPHQHQALLAIKGFPVGHAV